MNGNADVGTEWEATKRFIALLFALARRADSAALASFPVRCFVLWLLRRCEPFALDYLGDDYRPTPFWRNSRADVARLAKIFRMAARAAEKELRREQRLVRKARSDDSASLTPDDEPEPFDDTAELPMMTPIVAHSPRRQGFRALDSPGRAPGDSLLSFRRMAH